MEPKLVVAATHLGQYVQIRPTKATPIEQLVEGVGRISVGFLVKILTHKVLLDKDKI